jgi:hypothetical protein
MGLPGSFSEWPFDTISKSLTDCWSKLTLNFLHKLDLDLHDNTLPRLKNPHMQTYS